MWQFVLIPTSLLNIVKFDTAQLHTEYVLVPSLPLQSKQATTSNISPVICRLYMELYSKWEVQISHIYFQFISKPPAVNPDYHSLPLSSPFYGRPM